MSEEIDQQSHKEDDFVWIDAPEIQVPVLVAVTQSDVVSVAKVVQSEVFDYDGQDSSVNESEEEEKLDKLYNWKCKNDTKRPVNTIKSTYTTPHVKQAELGLNKINNGKKQKHKGADSLLPTIDFGELTNALLKRIIDQRYIGRYNNVVGKGKNSIVFNAPHHRRNCVTMPFNNAVKVYKLGMNEDENKATYRRVCREFEHLSIVSRKLGNCPRPVRPWDNVILMSFAGCEQTVTPTIQDAPLSEEYALYRMIVNFIDTLYNVLNLVHGKLSAKNIRYLQSRNSLEYIGWGHSVKKDHPQALIKLIKDCDFVTKFYKERDVDVKATEDLFMEITGCTKISSKLLNAIKKKDLYEKYDKNPNRRCPRPIKPNGSLRFK